MKNWQNLNVLILGAARQGLALASFLSKRGAHVTINDKKSPEELKTAKESLKSYSIEWQLGHHNMNILEGKDLLCISGGVPLSLQIIQQALVKQIPISNDSQIFMEHTPCKVIGITGSAGKTTTTTLLGLIADAAYSGSKKVWVGGNIGRPLIDVIDQITPDDIVILEFSSFQLELMKLSPSVSAILNITPNHLDRHITMDAYLKAKSSIFKYQSKDDWMILGFDDPGTRNLIEQVPGKLITFGLQPHRDGGNTVYCRDNLIYFNNGQDEIEIMPVEAIELRGNHNLLNVLAACALSVASELPINAMQEGVKNFKGVPHRLEFVRLYKGASWYNDLKATSPEGSLAAVNAFEEPLVLLLGGRDKHLPWTNLARKVIERVEHLIVFGEASEKILDAVEQVGPGNKPETIDHRDNLKAAVLRAAEISKKGDVVLLAPGGNSFDEFNNYEERGELFKTWVNKLT